MRNHIKPHKFPDYKELKIPMPSPKNVMKLEKIRAKGIEVSYPRAPWYTDNVEKILEEAKETEKRIKESAHAHLLEKLPVDRSKSNVSEKVKVEKKIIP
eukprot:CAMPEP_0170559418 /NCGR_PEP_ID=MMETSP0211-20121228/42542_1 /TAXON_ID=311385 /ORGANISM="Pseudokeronopsis sp., Strain OXSARD2" /LENGTH=98 /DNA_ID=CAMNT_0010872409 /DNA_START=208 /DNA_END=500 /DNA_ORIENTATION=+